MEGHTCKGFLFNLKLKDLLLIQIFEVGTFNPDLLSLENPLLIRATPSAGSLGKDTGEVCFLCLFALALLASLFFHWNLSLLFRDSGVH